VIQTEKDGIRWVLAPAFEPLLAKTLADPGEVIKKTPTKLVTVHQINGKSIYVKKYLNAAKRLRPLKYYFKASEAKSEWALAAQVAARGIPVVPHLAMGEHWTASGLQQSIIITEGFDGVRLDKFPNLDSDDLQAALARLLRAMHDNGVLQRDLHHNIMVKARPLELCRIDVDRGELLPPLTEEQRIENMAYISVFVPLRAKFFEVYNASDDLIAKIQSRSRVIRRGLWARRSSRCLEHNLRFNPKIMGGLRWWVRLEFLNENLRALMENPDKALEKCTKLFKSGPNRQSTVGSFDGLVLKRFNVKNRLNYVKDLFRPSRAFRAYQKAYHLELLGLPTPRPVAAAERRILRVLTSSYLVTEEIPGATDLAMLLRSGQSPARNLVNQTAELIARLHDEGFSHSDLKETNIVRDQTGKLYVLDLDALSYARTVSEERAAADLERLARAAAKYPNVTRADRIAFLRAYFKARKLKRIPRAT
jgi:tRNA A-37 threonylcarbamoyl transferase component Bud32